MSTKELCYSNICLVTPSEEHKRLAKMAVEAFERDKKINLATAPIDGNIIYDNQTGYYDMRVAPQVTDMGPIYIAVRWKKDATTGKMTDVNWNAYQNIYLPEIPGGDSDGSIVGAVAGGALIVGGAIVTIAGVGTTAEIGVPMMLAGSAVLATGCPSSTTGPSIDNDVDAEGKLDGVDISLGADTANPPEAKVDIIEDPGVEEETEISDIAKEMELPKDVAEEMEVGTDMVNPDTEADDVNVNDEFTAGDETSELKDLWEAESFGEISDANEIGSDELDDAQPDGLEEGAFDVENDDAAESDVTPMLLSGINFCFVSNDCNKEPKLSCIELGGFLLDNGEIQEVTDFSVFVNPNAGETLKFWSPTVNKEITFTQMTEPTGVTGDWSWLIEGEASDTTGAMNLVYLPEDNVFDLNFFMDDISSAYKYCKHYYTSCSTEECEAL